MTLCPEPAAGGAYGEVLFELPADRPGLVLKTDGGISDSSGGRGSVTFVVETSDAADGEWQSLYDSGLMRGGNGPESVTVPLGDAKFLRLRNSDGGDGINSDHAVWGAPHPTDAP